MNDLLAAAGALMLATGLGLYSVPLMLVVVGGLLLAAGLWRHLHGVDPRPPAPPAE